MIASQIQGYRAQPFSSPLALSNPSPATSAPALPPQRTYTEHTRKILSCRTCRRRKLRCDRQYPRCGRCQRHRDTCSYDDQRGSESLITPRSRSKSPRHSPSRRFWQTQREPTNQRESAEDDGDDNEEVETGDEDEEAGDEKAETQRLVVPSNHSAPTHHHHHYYYDQPEQQHRGVGSSSGAKKKKTSSSSSSSSSNNNNYQYQLGPVNRADSGRARPDITSRAGPGADTVSLESFACRGRDFKTQYYGTTSPRYIITHFPELRAFMEAAVQHTSLPRAQGELKAFQVRWKAVKAKEYSVTDAELLHLLPERTVVDGLVRLYFETCESVFRILHGPSFWKEYQIFWENLPAAGKPAFVVLLLLAMAAVSCVSLKEYSCYAGDSSMARERAMLWIDISERWLRRQSPKRSYLAIWQIRCLLLLAKQTNAVKKKHLWTAAGTLVREAMSAGFHRDLSRIEVRISPFDCEIRRRLWTTIVELELQASVDRGMPSVSAGLPSSNFDSVLNINDDELAVDCQTLPESRPGDEYTSCSYLHISSASFALRVLLSTLVNDTSSPLGREEVAGYEDAVTQELDKLAHPADPQKTGRPRGMLPPIVRALLDIQLRQFLLLLHAPSVRQTDYSSLRSLPSMVVCLNTAATILEQHSKIMASGNLLLLLLRQDYLSGGLVMCQNMYSSISLQSNLFFNSTSNTCVHYIENALALLEERITRLGTGHMQYWYMSAACGLLRSTISPHEAAPQKQRAVDRVLRQIYRVLTSQVDLLEAKKIIIPPQLSQLSVADPLQTSYDRDNVAKGGFEPTSLGPTDLSLEEFFFGDPTAWTSENFPFSSTSMEQGL